MKIIDIFPTNVALSQREWSPQFDVEEQHALHLADTDQVKINGNGNGISLDTYILEKEPFTNLKDWVQTQVDDYFEKTFSPSDDVSLFITQSWLNYAQKDQFHSTHYHRNCVIAGVYYVNASSDDKLTFNRPSNMFDIFHIPYRETTPYNSNIFHLGVRTGTLLLFPGYLFHEVSPILQPHHTRISLAFNTWIQGSVGEEQNTTLVHTR